MKATLLVLILSISFQHAICQKTKTITTKFDDSDQIAERYSVLKSNTLIKHGTYTSFYDLTNDEKTTRSKGAYLHIDLIKETGNYINGKKNGEWIEYSKYFPKEYIKGYHLDDVKIGIWSTTKEQLKVIEQYDYDNNKKLNPIIKIYAVYPESAIVSKIEGTVTITYKVQEDCSINNIEVTNGLSKDCNDAAIKAVEKYASLFKKYNVYCEQKKIQREITFHYEE